ncbi:MAG: hypothetical protein M3460_24920 [Actinomycetota bacterium]|nr:hypothetical protein [Actinomycetota bacterium]
MNPTTGSWLGGHTTTQAAHQIVLHDAQQPSALYCRSFRSASDRAAPHSR